MKQLLLLALVALTTTAYAQGNNSKFKTASFEKTYRQEPLIIKVRKARKTPTIRLPKRPNLVWRQRHETGNYYNKNGSNVSYFNPSNNWDMVYLPPKNQPVLYYAAAISRGALFPIILDALNKKKAL
ncbi:MAG: Unknown protein [uncultured Aureispira sp.]|uniref:Uncharacterized protein n=1 Tax=uncultured Aureispira sp. TaxID=1331704 RepID=A0A6S6U9C6_9BACT|nr:MAG: Unknown protein [uncultured Aureispira sp.]